MIWTLFIIWSMGAFHYTISLLRDYETNAEWIKLTNKYSAVNVKVLFTILFIVVAVYTYFMWWKFLAIDIKASIVKCRINYYATALIKTHDPRKTSYYAKKLLKLLNR